MQRINIFNCNVCEQNRCKLFAEMEKKKTWEDTSNCQKFVSPKSFSMPILTHLLTEQKKVKATTTVLGSFKFRLKERESYPYFVLHFSKARRE